MKLLWTLLFFITNFSCRPLKVTNIDCAGYHVGNFYYKMYNNSGLGHWKEVTNSIHRNDSIEIEIGGFFIGDTTESYIRWLSECKYELTLKRTTMGIRDTILRNYYKGPVIYTITKGTGEYYIYSTRRRLDTIWIDKYPD